MAPFAPMALKVRMVLFVFFGLEEILASLKITTVTFPPKKMVVGRLSRFLGGLFFCSIFSEASNLVGRLTSPVAPSYRVKL